jgi:VPDSG-CTERM motif
MDRQQTPWHESRYGTAIMKTKLFVSLAALAFFVGASEFVSGFTLGDAANYAVLYEGSGSHTLTVNSNPLNGSTVLGNIGLGDENGGNPKFQLNNPAVVNGNVNFAATGPANYSNASGTLNGSVNTGVTQVETDLDYLNGLSASLGAESGTNVSIGTGAGQTLTINASAGTFTGADSVFTVTAMQFQNGQTLTINGDGVHDVVLNFGTALGGLHFAGAIVLNGLTSNDVLFNIFGGNSTTLTGGDTLQTAANNATQYGTYLDPNGNIVVNSVNIVGHLFGGDSADMQIVSGATVHSPSVPDGGSSVALLGIALAGIEGVRRTLRAHKASS